MKESVTKFDFESAFKALDEIDIPASEKGIKANRPALTEIFSRKSKFDSLFEEYYDVNSTEELGEAQEAREAEIAKAKLARIEKIVDLDAESPEDLLTSYVGKYIMQCPQCMTLFYKDKEDIVESEDDPNTVNVSEVCQHCGNESGYTLIGKVGEAEAEAETTDEATGDVDLGIEPVEDDGADEIPVDTEEATADEETEAEEDFDLDMSSLDDLNLDDEESEEEEKKEESVFTVHSGEALVEELTEDAKTDLDISDAEFEKLINSPEFKQPISDSAVQAMLDSNSDDNKEDVEEGLSGEELEEGIFDKLKTGIKNIGDKMKLTHAGKADWVLKNAMKDYDKVSLNDKGEVVIDESNLRFTTYLVIQYKNTFSNNTKITRAPAYDNPNLVPAAKPLAGTNYDSADKTAKGWSQQEGNGPAIILLAKNTKGEDAVFLGMYYAGKLCEDKVDDVFNKVKQTLDGALKRAQGREGGMTEVSEETDTKEIKGNEITVGAKLKFDDKIGEVVTIEDSAFGSKYKKITIKFGDDTTTIDIDVNSTVIAVVETEATSESFKPLIGLATIMEQLEELHEESLEQAIASTLVETYQNVSGYKLTGCEYTANDLVIEGTVQFKSGNTRNITHHFSEAYEENGKITLNGLSEKLGRDKTFTLTGNIDTTTNSFITESFSRN